MQVYLCEKPSQAKDIAAVLGCKRVGDVFAGDGKVVTWCIGHILQQAEPKEYHSDWERWDMALLPMLPPEWKMVVTPKTKSQFSVVKKALSKATEVIIATDADREGEVIAREVLEFINYRGPIRRLWLSALDDASIRKALSALKPGEETAGLYDAGKGRSRGDWLIGMNMSRLCTLLGRQLGYQVPFSVGRVQTPTLRLVVDRDRQIEQFVPIPYFDVVAVFSAEINVNAKWLVPEVMQDEHGRCINVAWSQQVISQCQGHPGIVSDFDTKRQKVKHPQLFFLGSLQKAMSGKYGYGAQEVLDIAQSLYEKHKVTTYPRTDCPYLPESQFVEAADIVRALSSVSAFSSWCSGANLTIKSVCWNDKKITAHHAIIPLPTTPNLDAMNDKERNVYQAIVQRYLAQWYPVAEDDASVAILSVGQHHFRASGRVEREKGWRIVMGKEVEEAGDESQETMPSLTVGQSLPGQYRCEQKQTKPPSRFTEGNLIDAMSSIAKLETDPKLKAILKETAGIGTEATRASIIETLKGREFLVTKGKLIISTETGRGLIDALPDVLTRPAMTALWEQMLDDIAQGRGSLDDFMARQQGFVSQMVSMFKAGQYSLNLPKIEMPESTCPNCSNTLKLITGKKGKVWICGNKELCGLLLDDDRGKPAKTSKCNCGKGVLVRRKAKTKGKFWWGCSAIKLGCTQRFFDDKGKLGKEMGTQP